MKIHYKLFILCLIFMLSPYSQCVENKNDPARLSKLLALTDSEIKTITHNTYTSPELKHRLFELYTEKIKLFRERETINMLKDNPETVNKRGRETYFNQSREQYVNTQKFGMAVINQYPNYSKVADIYYTLAINSRDFGTNSETEKYLVSAIKFSHADSKTLYNSKTSLAEYYYNEKRYADAISYYEDVLKNKKDEWYGKHLYNASWCFLKERNFSRALELMKESFDTTNDKKYVSIREQILNAIGIFFIQANQTAQGINFFEKNTNPASTYLLMLANSSMNKNNFNLTDEILSAALKDSINHKDQNLELKVRIAQLDIYRESKKDDLFFNTSNNIVGLFKKNQHLSSEDIANVQNKLKDVAGFMQVNLVKDKTKDIIDYNKDDFNKIIKYFDMLTVIDHSNKSLYRYYQGETALSIHDYHTAMKFYVRSIMNTKKTKNQNDFTKKSLNALMLSMEEAKLSKKTADEYFIYAFKNYLIFYPKSEKSQLMYQKLFNKYFELNKLKMATNILLVYQNNYKEDDKIHREMLTQLLDNYIKIKNTDMLAFWINKIEKGYLNFSSDYIQTSIAALGDILFDRYHELEKKGMVKEAMNGYEEIYNSKKYPNRIKAEAAYAMAAALLDLNNSDKSYKWLSKSLEIYESNDLVKITTNLFSMNKNYRLLQNFEVTKELSNNITKKFCNEQFEQKDGFYELLMTTSAMENMDSNKLLSMENDLKNCKLSERIIKRVRTEILTMMIESDQFKNAKNYFIATEHTDLSRKMFNRYIHFKFYQNPEIYRREVEEIAKLNIDLKLNEMISHFDQIIAFKEKITHTKFEFTSLEKFDADKFNSELDQYLSILNEYSKEAILLSKESAPEELVVMREVLSSPFLSLNLAINAFTPKGVDNKYLSGFKTGMRQISESLVSKALTFDREKIAFLEKNNYFFQIQKHDKFDKSIDESDSKSLDKLLEDHPAIIFANTLDVSMAYNSNMALENKR